MTYQAICFDHGGVIVGRPAAEFNAAACQLLGVDHATYTAAYFRYNKLPNRGEITWPEMLKMVVDELGKTDKYDAFMELWNKSGSSRSLNPEMLVLVDSLRAQGYKVGLLSNNTADVLDEIKSMGVDKHFDVVHISAITGFVKPEPEAFQHLAKALNVSLSAMIFIDDSPKSLSTAEECGYSPILFENYQQLVTDLDNLGVKT